MKKSLSGLTSSSSERLLHQDKQMREQKRVGYERRFRGGLFGAVGVGLAGAGFGKGVETHGHSGISVSQPSPSFLC